jgi:hypothetical protein
MYKFLTRGSRITILEGPYTGQKGWVDSIAFGQPTGVEEKAFCYQATLESGKWINVRCLHVAPGWLNDDDLVWLLGRLPRLTFPKTELLPAKKFSDCCCHSTDGFQFHPGDNEVGWVFDLTLSPSALVV